MKRILTLFLTLMLLLSAMLSTLSCSCSFEPEAPISKETIEEKMTKEEVPAYSKVSEYLKYWSIPSFDATQIDAMETAASARFYQGEVTAETVARTVANRFLDDNVFYAINRSNKKTVTLALNRLYCEALAEITVTPLTDQELLDASASEALSFDFASQYLLAWGMPVFYAFKLLEVENVVASYYYDQSKKPTTYALAKSVVEAFVAADKTEVTDITGTTDLILREYVVGIGDKYAAYRTVDEYQEYDDDMSGNYVGIGVVVEYSYAEETLTVTGYPDDSPAKEAGILLGDILYAVNGEEAKTLGYEATIAKVRGEEGTEVTVTVLRGEAYIDFTITRKKLADNTVTYTKEGDIGYIRITQFKANTGTLFRKAIDEAEADKVKAYVFDLRSNPGGYLDSVAVALSYLVPKGTRIASFSVESYGVIDATDAHTIDLPCVVLCNGYTASAGELFTASLRDWGSEAFNLLDVTVVGTETYKKGVMQNTFTLSDQSTLTLTVSYYNPPTGVNYDGIGITPDVVLELSEDEDNQKAYAIDLLNEKINPEP